MKKLTLVLLWFAVLPCFAGDLKLKLKMDLELSVGVTAFRQQDNGIWYQEGFDHSLKLKSAAYSAKLFTKKSEDGWQVGVGYTYIGSASSSAIATASDANYNAETHGCNGPCWPMSHWYGKGKVHGVSLLLRKNFDSGLYLEGGVMASRATYAVNVPDWIGCAECVPANITAVQPTKVMFDPTVGVGYRKGNWAASLSLVPTHMIPGSYAIYKGASPVFMITYIIPL